MIFLKKLYAEGFKSFAKPTTINFDHNMTAIIGPNGSGKSNVVDAIRWTIGEQSMKQLRGSDKTNLIFMGSENLSESPFALVELTFDNTARMLNKDLDEIKISRKLIRKTGESIYLLNDEPAKLKEIQEIFLDTGLTKGSLGIISQGTVNWFSDTKPEERRKIFEEASGIGKYTKKKAESLRQLETAKINLDNVSVRIKSTEKELEKLKKQAQKLEEYRTKFEKLKELDLIIKARDYDKSKEIFEQNTSLKIELDNQKETLESNISYYKSLIEQKNTKYDQTKIEVDQLEKQKNELNEEYTKYERKLDARKSSINNQLFSDNPEEKVKAYLSLINEEKANINTSLERKSKIEERLESRKIEIHNLQSEVEGLRNRREELKDQYKDKERDFLYLQKNLAASSNETIQKIIENKSNFPGVVGQISNLIKVKPRYETAIMTALGGTIKNIVTLNEATAHDVIKFANKNRLGYLTYLPLDVIQPKSIPNDLLNVIKDMKGFIDVAANLVTINDEYKVAIDHIIGNVLVADDIENASLISHKLNQKFRIVTLEGDSKNVGGSLSGGYKNNDRKVIFNIEEKIELAKKEYEELKNEHNNVLLNLENLSSNLKTLMDDQNIDEKSLDLVNSKLIDFQKSLESNEIQYEIELAKCKGFEADKDKSHEELVAKTLELRNEFLDINEKYENKKSENEKILNDIRSWTSEKDKNEIELRKVNEQLSLSVSEIHKSQTKLQAIEEETIKNYEISIDALRLEYLNKELEVSEPEARRTIAILQSEIKALGPINTEVLNELEQKQKEFDNIDAEYQNSLSAYEKFQEIIKELDKKAISDFKTLIKKVNENIPAIFNELFGGGYCEIKLTNPEDVLESGIDVIVQPRGKKVKNLTLLSGGEKTLVALTVLFAILQSSKLPLIVLDEAEAALDELNVEIFAKIIKKYSEKTQFVVITHRPGTMKETSALYGITMQDKGVSIVLKTSFEKINFKELE